MERERLREEERADWKKELDLMTSSMKAQEDEEDKIN